MAYSAEERKQRARDAAARWLERNRGLQASRVAAWRKQNPDKCKAMAKAWRDRKKAEDPEAWKAMHRRKGEARDPEQRKAWRLSSELRKYGLSEAQYQAMAEKQGGKCAICQGVSKTGRRLSIDHCHSTGRVRGLLCDGCNLGLGHLEHVLTQAAAYLEG